MHTMWKGSISFGLVHIPIKLYAATESKDVHFRSLHDKCETPIRYQKFCPTCEREIEASEIIKGYEYEPGQFVKVSEEEIKEIKGEAGRSVEILDFVDLHEVDPIFYNKSYFIGPNENGEKAYSLLKRAMADTNKIGLAKITLHSKSHLAVVRVYQNGLLLETIFYPDEVRQIDQVPGLNQVGEVNEKELDTAKHLIEQLTADFEPEKYVDDYREAVEEMIQAKIAGNDIIHTEKAPERQNVVDLLSALEASIQTSKTSKKQPKQDKTKKTAKTSLKKKKAGSE
ncbi:non-homologous end joining protein Ku [Pullulanibacillus camelliae]|uniref:Non-homologous end joining protein Ku n=1 Tax=Pullulanibacillus camelliae TaxID=1707096 RepID=A0A8J2YLA0_9BACL|nr:Ku protein [Pullulanibacillus camelliae]GGE50999.1 non-homologous end joining protein Ku [Pullulanibacillus camelliae]